MTVEEYRQKMINAFHNADCDNLIALVALPTKKEFEHLEWLLKKHYHNQKQQSCEDTISRQVVLDKIKEVCFSKEQKWVDFRVSQGSNGERDFIINFIESLPSTQPKEKTGKWG